MRGTASDAFFLEAWLREGDRGGAFVRKGDPKSTEQSSLWFLLSRLSKKRQGNMGVTNT